MYYSLVSGDDPEGEREGGEAAFHSVVFFCFAGNVALLTFPSDQCVRSSFGSWQRGRDFQVGFQGNVGEL